MVEAREKFKLRLLGPFGLFSPSGERIEIPSRKSVAMIALLASAPDGLRTRNWLKSILWEGRDQTQTNSSFRREISNLAKIFERAGAEGVFRRETQRVSLALELLDIDIVEFSVDNPDSRVGFDGEFLEGLDLKGCEQFEDWLRSQRTRYDDLRAMRFPAIEPKPDPWDPQQDGGTSGNTNVDDLVRGQPLKIPPTPSVTVLPFQSMGEDADEKPWLSEGIAEEIGLTLSQFPQLFVVAPTSAAALDRRGATPMEIAKQLGVKYLLGGAIQQIDRTLRIIVRLIDGETGQQVWTTTQTGDEDDFFELQENIAVSAAPKVWSNIDIAERRRSLYSSEKKVTNYENYWRANALFRAWSKESILEAILITDKMVSTDPLCPFASSLSAFCNGIAYAFGWTKSLEATRRRAEAGYQNALRYGAENVEVLGYVTGTLVSIRGDMELADRLIDRGLSLIPRYQPILFWGGWVDLVTGNAERARKRFDLSLRVNPAASVKPYTIAGIGISHLLDQNVETAIRLLRESVAEIPFYPPAQAALFVAAKKGGESTLAEEAAKALSDMDAGTALSMLQSPEGRKLASEASSKT